MTSRRPEVDDEPKSEFLLDNLSSPVHHERLYRSFRCYALETAIEALKTYEAISGDKQVTAMRMQLSRKLDAE